MNEATVFGGYDRKALDAQYDNRARHPEHAQLHAAWTADGDKVLAEFDHRLDIAYGPSADEKLDVYLPKRPKRASHGAPKGNAKRAPVNVFLHGGYWYSRHKDHFRFVARGLVPAGAILVVVNYALVPAVDLDEQVRQCRAAVAWTYRHAGDFGGDRDRLFVSGHSAGGHLTAMMLATDWPSFESGLPRTLVKGGAALSGIYDLEPIRHCYLQDTLRFTADQEARNSPDRLAPATDAPVLIAVGGGETDEFLRQSDILAAAWSNRLADCRLMVVPGLNHFTMLGAFADPASALNAAVRKQMGLA